MPNYNPETSIPYGVIACDFLNSDLVEELWHTHGTDLSYEEALIELRNELEAEADEIEAGEPPDDDTYLPTGYGDREAFIEGEMDCRSQNIEIDEPTIEGEYEGVKYHISRLGGAPLLLVFESPFVNPHAQCSPCCPGAGDLDSEGDVLCYDVPDSWRRSDESTT